MALTSAPKQSPRSLPQHHLSLRPWPLLAVLACIPTYTGFLGGLWWRLELTSHFRVQYLIVLSVCAVALGIARKWKYALPLALTALLNLLLILPLYLGPPPPAHHGSPLKILLANVHTSNTQHHRLLDLVREENPHIIILLEVNTRWVAALREISDDYPHVKSAPRSDNFGIALLSRIPLRNARIIESRAARVPSVIAQFALDEQPVTLVGTHPLPPVSRTYSRLRNAQMRDLAAFVKSQEDPVVLIGDLNMTSWSPYFAKFLRQTALRDSRKGFGIHPTWPAFNPLLRIPIDHCLVSPRIIVLDRRIGPPIGSDHNPLLLTIALPPAGPDQPTSPLSTPGPSRLHDVMRHAWNDDLRKPWHVGILQLYTLRTPYEIN